MVHSVAMLFTAATLAMIVFSSTTVAETKDLETLLGQLQKAVRPRHCGHLRHAGQTSNGVYTIYPIAADESGQRVYCDMETDGGDWTVIQRRGQYGNHRMYFYKNWEEYASGFGNPKKEYWIGNRAIHALTSGEEQMTLRVMLDNNTKTLTIDYRRFKISSEHDNFSISVGDYVGPEGWDTMIPANGQPFFTFDRNTAKNSSEGNCAKKYHGAWWHKFPCTTSNLNGLNFNGAHFFTDHGIHWLRYDTNSEGVLWMQYSFPWVHMMIRPTEGLSYRRRR
ncbi:techylectin-5A-like [Haemaphysalis longicornis]